MLRILGFTFLVLIVAAAILIGLGIRQDQRAREYVTSSVHLIYDNWNFAELHERASTELLREPGFETNMPGLFKMTSGVLGPLVSAGEPTGSAGFGWGKSSVAQGTYGQYHVRAKFKAGDADLEFVLVKEHGMWRIRGFNIESPLLIDAVRKIQRGEPINQ